MVDTVNVSPEELDRTGYLVFKDVLSIEEDLQPLLDEFADVLDNLANSLYHDGKISQTHAGLPFGKRLIEVMREAGFGVAQHFDISFPSRGVHFDTPIHTGPACFKILTNPRLLDIAEQLIGGEIEVSPVGHMRFKLPSETMPADTVNPMMGRSPWHQDNGVVLPEADNSNILTVWVAVTESTIENGCLQVQPTERTTPLQEHCSSPMKGAHIPDKCIDFNQVVSLPMKPGSVLMMHPRTRHGSLDNTTTDQVRISMDLRYQPIGQPTGRPQFPSFIARSRSNPDSVLRDPAEWSRMWMRTRAKLAIAELPKFNRWDPNSILCA